MSRVITVLVLVLIFMLYSCSCYLFTDVSAVNVYVWGRNPNVTLGHDRTRDHPEKLTFSLPPTICIIKVGIHYDNKFVCAVYI